MAVLSGFPHIQFARKWSISGETARELGNCEAIIWALADTPIKPVYRSRLLRVALTKGAQSTTAIEGNTLTGEEIEQIEAGRSLAPSKEYQQIEVRNILNAFNTLLNEIVTDGSLHRVTTDLLLKFHKMIGQDLGDHFQAIPGRFREKNVSVGKYRAPDRANVRELCEGLSEWVYREFHIDQGQTFADAVIQAIVCHVYIAWIHPFGDGNGRTARLLEFYILLRAGNPDFASHILSNFYNETRSEYYRQLEASTRTGDLSAFIAYAVKGYRDGLRDILRIVQNNQLDVSWSNFIHETFNNAERKGQSKVTHRRRRTLMLAFPIGQSIPLKQIKRLNVDIAAEYSHLSDRTLSRDLKALEDLSLVIETEDDIFQANTDLLMRFKPKKKKIRGNPA